MSIVDGDKTFVRTQMTTDNVANHSTEKLYKYSTTSPAMDVVPTQSAESGSSFPSPLIAVIIVFALVLLIICYFCELLFYGTVAFINMFCFK